MTARIVAFSIIVAVGALSASLAAAAQPEKAVRVGVLRPAPDDPVFRQLFEPFRSLFQWHRRLKRCPCFQWHRRLK